MKPKHIISFLASLMIITACQDKKKEEAVSALKEWMGKEILFPKNSIFTIRGADTIDFALNASDYKIVSYIDTAGCVACQLKLAEWQRFMDEVDAASSTHTPFIFYLYPKDTKDLLIEFRREAFDYPVCLDEKDEFNRLNKLAESKALRTFLLDKENKIVAIGNPIENPNVKKFYLKLLTGKEQETSAIQTTVELSAQELDFGTFPKEETKAGEILFKNTGDKPFVIYDVVTSCGCTKVDYPNTPIPPGSTLKFTVTYEADKPGFFNKSLKVYGNMKGSPVKLVVRGQLQ